MNKNKANNRRRLKTAAKGKAREKKLRLAKAAEQERAQERVRAKKNWPPESRFSSDDELFWRCHGVNYLVSDADEGLWKPLFPAIYEGVTVAPEAIVKAILEGEGGDVPIAWSAQPRSVIYAVRQRCIVRLKSDAEEELTKEEIEEKLVSPHNALVWDVFFDLSESLSQKRAARTEAQPLPEEEEDPLVTEALKVEPEPVVSGELTAEAIQDVAKQVLERGSKPEEALPGS